MRRTMAIYLRNAGFALGHRPARCRRRHGWQRFVGRRRGQPGPRGASGAQARQQGHGRPRAVFVIVSDEIREGVAMANFNYPGAPANSVCHAVPDTVTGNYRYKLGRRVLSKVGESPYKHSFTSMSLKPRLIV